VRPAHAGPGHEHDSPTWGTSVEMPRTRRGNRRPTTIGGTPDPVEYVGTRSRPADTGPDDLLPLAGCHGRHTSSKSTQERMGKLWKERGRRCAANRTDFRLRCRRSTGCRGGAVAARGRGCRRGFVGAEAELPLHVASLDLHHTAAGSRL
jgi:hypothetical protein